MKKTLTMVVVILALGSQAIANGLSELKLRTNANVPLKVIIDGQLVSNNASFVEIKSIPYGNHTLQVFQILRSYNSYNEESLFFGQIFLPQNTSTHALIKHHKFLIEQQLALEVEPQTVVYNYQGNNIHHTKPIFWQNEPQYVIEPVVCGVHVNQYNPEPIEEIFPIDNEIFSNLKTSISNKWFSDEKIIILKQALADGHLFTTKQVKQLIELYSFSSDRLTVAKLLYHNTIDQENYFMVYDSLHWDSSIANLSNYIASL